MNTDTAIQQILTEGTIEQKTELLKRMAEIAETPEQKSQIELMTVYFTRPGAMQIINDYIWVEANKSI